MNSIAANLEESTEWMVALHKEEILVLGNIDTFLEGVWASFRDPTQAQWVEPEICLIWQRNRSVAEYIREFDSLAGKLGG